MESQRMEIGSVASFCTRNEMLSMDNVDWRSETQENLELNDGPGTNETGVTEDPFLAASKEDAEAGIKEIELLRIQHTAFSVQAFLKLCTIFATQEIYVFDAPKKSEYDQLIDAFLNLELDTKAMMHEREGESQIELLRQALSGRPRELMTTIASRMYASNYGQWVSNHDWYQQVSGLSLEEYVWRSCCICTLPVRLAAAGVNYGTSKRSLTAMHVDHLLLKLHNLIEKRFTTEFWPQLAPPTLGKSDQPFEFLWPDSPNNGAYIMEPQLWEDLHDLPYRDLNTFYIGFELFEELLRRFMQLANDSPLPDRIPGKASSLIYVPKLYRLQYHETLEKHLRFKYGNVGPVYKVVVIARCDEDFKTFSNMLNKHPWWWIVDPELAKRYEANEPQIDETTLAQEQKWWNQEVESHDKRYGVNVNGRMKYRGVPFSLCLRDHVAIAKRILQWYTGQARLAAEVAIEQQVANLFVAAAKWDRFRFFPILYGTPYIRDLCKVCLPEIPPLDETAVTQHEEKESLTNCMRYFWKGACIIEMQHVVPDSSSLFRCISLVLYKTDRHHTVIRRKLCDFLADEIVVDDQWAGLCPQAADLVDYMDRIDLLRNESTSGDQTTLLGLAVWLDCAIFVYEIGMWHPFSPQTVRENLTKQKESWQSNYLLTILLLYDTATGTFHVVNKPEFEDQETISKLRWADNLVKSAEQRAEKSVNADKVKNEEQPVVSKASHIPVEKQCPTEAEFNEPDRWFAVQSWLDEGIVKTCLDQLIVDVQDQNINIRRTIWTSDQVAERENLRLSLAGKLNGASILSLNDLIVFNPPDDDWMKVKSSTKLGMTVPIVNRFDKAVTGLRRSQTMPFHSPSEMTHSDFMECLTNANTDRNRIFRCISMALTGYEQNFELVRCSFFDYLRKQFRKDTDEPNEGAFVPGFEPVEVFGHKLKPAPKAKPALKSRPTPEPKHNQKPKPKRKLKPKPKNLPTAKHGRETKNDYINRIVELSGRFNVCSKRLWMLFAVWLDCSICVWFGDKWYTYAPCQQNNHEISDIQDHSKKSLIFVRHEFCDVDWQLLLRVPGPRMVQLRCGKFSKSMRAEAKYFKPALIARLLNLKSDTFMLKDENGLMAIPAYNENGIMNGQMEYVNFKQLNLCDVLTVEETTSEL